MITYQCELCKQMAKLTHHERIAQGAGGSVVPENIMWICDECHKRINSITDRTIHKLKTGEVIPSIVSIPQVGSINVWAGSVCCSSPLTPIQFIPPISNPAYVQAHPKDFDKQTYPYKIIHNSGVFTMMGGSVSGWVYVSVV